MRTLNALEKNILAEYHPEIFWLGFYKRLETKASRVGFVGELPPCHEFEFGKGNVGLTAENGVRKVIADVSSDPQYSQCFIATKSELVEPVFYEDQLVGVMDAESDTPDFFKPNVVERLADLAARVAPVLKFDTKVQLATLDWLGQIRTRLNGKGDWVGVYWIESFADKMKPNSSDLVVGPYLGPRTPHVRISQDAGLCGLAVREERTVNVDDVRADSRFLACSTSTRSEIVIPIRTARGNVVGELDIDSNQLAAFTSDDQEWLEDWVVQFGAIL